MIGELRDMTESKKEKAMIEAEEGGGRNKTEYLRARCTPVQKAEFEAFADLLGMSHSELIWTSFVDYRARNEQRAESAKTEKTAKKAQKGEL